MEFYDENRMKSPFFLLFAVLVIFCVLSPQIPALEHDGGDKMTLPETTEFSKKFNKFMEPVSFGVGSEPGFDNNAIYIYLMYRYAQNFSWMIRFDMETSIKDDKDVDFKNPSKGVEIELDKKKLYTLSILPVVRHFKYLDLGFGVIGQYNHYEIDNLDSSSEGNIYLQMDRDVFLVGPLIYMHWQYPLSEHVDIGGTTELSPILWAFLKDKTRTAVFFDDYETSGRDTEKDFGIGVPSINQNIYLTFLKFINLSAGITYDFFRIGDDDTQVSHDATLRFGLALLKKPKSGFLNYLIGVFYETEWSFMDVGSEHMYDRDGRWIFCVGASG